MHYQLMQSNQYAILMFLVKIFKRRNKKYDKDEDEIILCFGKIKYNTNTIGFIASYACASQFFHRTGFFGGSK